MVPPLLFARPTSRYDHPMVRELWLRNALKYTGWVAEHGRTPRLETSETVEKSLSKWMAKQRAADREGVLVADRRVWLDENIPGWRVTVYQVKFERNLTALVEFVDTHGRYPSKGSNDPAERLLARWVINRRYREHEDARSSQFGVEELDRRLPGWRTP